jgi:hypothetical protein
MNNNAAWKFYLESKDYQKAIDKGIISMDDFSKNLISLELITAICLRKLSSCNSLISV